jgi:hypothetical protein
MDPLTLLAIFGTNFLMSKAQGAKTKDALKGSLLNTATSSFMPGGTSGQIFGNEAMKAGLTQASNQFANQSLSQILKDRAKDFAAQKIATNVLGMKSGEASLLSNLTGNFGMGDAFAQGVSPVDEAMRSKGSTSIADFIRKSQQAGRSLYDPSETEGGAVDVASILEKAFGGDQEGGGIDVASILKDANVKDRGTGNGISELLSRAGGVIKESVQKDGKYDMDKIVKGATVFGLPLLLYATGAFKPKPVTSYMPTYNINYPKLREARGPMKRIDPATGQEVEVAQVGSPEELYGSSGESPYAWSEKTFYPKKYNTGGLAELQKFNEGGVSYLPTKSTHDEDDMHNYMRVNGHIEDHNGYKDEDTVLAQLADGEFVTRTDGVLGAGIIAGANPKNVNDMRKKGAKFFYEQQKRFKRVFDLINANRASTVS